MSKWCAYRLNWPEEDETAEYVVVILLIQGPARILMAKGQGRYLPPPGGRLYLSLMMFIDHLVLEISMLTLSSMSVPLSSSSTTSRELLSQFSTCSG